jgi:hypothetical protein
MILNTNARITTPMPLKIHSLFVLIQSMVGLSFSKLAHNVWLYAVAGIGTLKNDLALGERMLSVPGHQVSAVTVVLTKITIQLIRLPAIAYSRLLAVVLSRR